MQNTTCYEQNLSWIPLNATAQMVQVMECSTSVVVSSLAGANICNYTFCTHFKPTFEACIYQHGVGDEIIRQLKCDCCLLYTDCTGVEKLD